jgi:quinate dehydrogenase (quinone)
MDTATKSDRNDRSKGGLWLGRIIGVVIGLIGLLLILGGVKLVLLGGSLYYVLIGIGYAGAAVLLWRRDSSGAWLTLALFAVTVLWALLEAGLNYWALFPRLLMPAGLTFLALIAALRFPAGRSRALPLLDASSRTITGGAAAAVGLFIIAFFSLSFMAHGVVRNEPFRPFVTAAASNQPSDWYSYARTEGGTRYSPFTQINRDNVKDLQPAWTFRSGDPGNAATYGVDQNVPLQIGDTLYSCSINDHIAALDADTGAVRWRFSSGASVPFWQRCRGLGYYQVPQASAGQPCAKRIINSTIDARLIALDALTGKLCADFGKNGVVDLKQGMGEVKPAYYFQTSAPIIGRGRILIGGWVVDNQETHEPSGVVRAFDARTGALSWAWDMGNSSVTKEPPPGGVYTRGTPNYWSTAAYDDKLGLFYVPLGNETPDFYGMTRNPVSSRYNSSVVALDVNTGRPRWSFQTVHHDIWDYDVPSQPALVDLPDGKGGTIPALLQTTKRAQLFLLNRATGQPISRVVEKPVPQAGHVPEERPSPTQPFSVDMPNFEEKLSERKAWGMTMLDQLACRISFRSMRYDGEFTPIGRQPAIEQPSDIGGFNWGSVSVDPVNHIAFMNDIRVPNVIWLVPPSEFQTWLKKLPPVTANGHGPSPQKGTPYSVINLLWLTKLGVPCNQPPYGTVSAVDLVAKKVLWQVPAGTVKEVGPLGIKSHMPMPIGMPTYAGTSVTAGGVLFFAGFQDYYLRAYDTRTGKELWKWPLPVGASATPMTYISPKTGRQYVVVSVGGAAHSPDVGDYVMSFALPRRS